MSDDAAARFDTVADRYSQRYADPRAVASFYVRLVRSWGSAVEPGASVLEVSCADGFMTEALIDAGYSVTGIDVSPRMVEVARARLAKRGLIADLRVADVATFVPDEPVDVLLAPMWTFFAYVHNAAAVLDRLAPKVRIKAIVDANPRDLPPQAAERIVAASGFDRTDWRPVGVPLTRKLGRTSRMALRAALGFAPARDVILKRRFNAAILGEKVRQKA